MLQSLNATIEAEFSRQPVRRRRAARDPYSMLGSSNPVWGEDMSNRQPAIETEQYKHNRGQFYTAGRIIVSRFAQQPFYVAREGVRGRGRSLCDLIYKGAVPPTSVPEWLGPSDNVELLSAHPAKRALMDPNPHVGSYNTKEMIAWSLVITGRGFLVAMESETAGRAFDLYCIPTTWMQPQKDGNWRIKPPSVQGDGIPIDDKNVAKFYFADPENPSKCLSPMAMMARSVLTDEAIADTQHSEFRDGVMPKVALIAGDVMNETSFTDDPNRSSSARPVRLEPHQRQQIITWFKQQYAGVRRHGLPIVLDAVIRDIKMLSRSPAEMAFIESAGLTKEQIQAGLGVSSVMTGQVEGVNRSSGALADQYFVDNTLNPMITMFSQALTTRIAPLFATGNERLLMWMAPSVPRDTELELEKYRIGIRSYSLKRNDVRAWIGLPPLDDMDDVVIPQTMEERDEDAPALGIGRMGSDIAEQNQRAIDADVQQALQSLNSRVRMMSQPSVNGFSRNGSH